MANIGTLTGELELENNASAVLNQFERDVTRVTSSAVSQFASLSKTSNTLLAVGAGLSAAVTAPIVLIGKKALDAGFQYEGAMNTIARKSGESGEALKSLQRDFDAVFVRVPNSAAEVATALTDVNTRLGLTGKILQDTTKRFLDFANVNQVEVTGATRMVSTIMGALELDVSEVTGVMDKLTFASQQSGVSVTRLAQGLVQGGTAFRKMGFDLDESLALFVQFERVGANVGDVTSTLHKTLTNFAKEGVTDAAVAFQSLIERIRDTKDEMQAIDIAREAFGAKFGSKLAEEIRGGTYEVSQLAETLRKLSGHTDRTAEASNSFKETLGTLRNQVTLLSGKLGMELLAAMNSTIPAMSALVKIASGLVDSFVALPSPIKTVTLVTLSLIAAIGPLTLAAGGFLKTASLWMPALTAANGILFTLGNTIPVLTARIWLMDASLKASAFSTRALATAQTFWGGILFTLGNTVPVLTARIWLMEAATLASATAAKAAAAAKTLFAGVLFTIGNSVPILTARIWLMNASNVAIAASAKLAAAGTLAFGSALLIIQGLTIVGLFAALAIAIYKVAGAVKDLYDTWKKGESMWAFFSARDDENFIRRKWLAWTGGADQAKSSMKGVSDEVKRLQDQLSGATVANEVDKLRRAWEALPASQQSSIDVQRRYGEQAAMLRTQGGQLHENLRNLADAFEDQAVSAGKAETAVDRLLKKAYAGLSETQRADISRLAAADVYSTKEIASAVGANEEAVKRFIKTQEEQAKSLKKTNEALEEHRNAVNALVAAYSGADVIKAAERQVEAVAKIGGATKLSKEHQAAYVKALDDVIAVYRQIGGAEGQKQIAHYQALRAAVPIVTGEFDRMQRELLELERAADNTTSSLRELSEIRPPFEAWQSHMRGLETNFSNSDQFLQNLFRDFRLLDGETKKQLETIPRLRSVFDQWTTSIGSLARGFEQLSNISGGALRGFAGEVGNLLGSLDLVSRAVDKNAEGVTAFQRGMQKVRDGNYAAGFAEIGTSVMGMASAFMQATSSGSTLMNILGGAATGAQIGGSFVPGIGHAVGAIVGGIGGFLRSVFGGPSKAELEGREVAHAYLAGLIKELSGAQRLEVQRLVDTGQWARGAAESVVALGGIYTRLGLTQQQANAMSTRLWQAEKQGAEEVKKVIQEIEELRAIPGAVGELLKEVSSSGALVSTELRNIINNMDDLGRSAAGVPKFVADEAMRAMNGLKQFLDNMVSKTPDGEDLAKGFMTAGGVEAATAAIGAAFSAMISGGMSAAEAIKNIGPMVLQLRDNMKTFGIEGSTAFQSVERMADYMSQEGFAKAITAVEGLNQMLIGTHNAGILDQQMFTGLTNEITATYDNLISRGFQGNEVIRLMQPSLQTIWELMNDFGLKIDDTTQKLIDQGLEAGAVGDKHRDVNDRIALGIERIVTLLEAFGTALGVKIPTEAGKAEAAIGNVVRRIPRNPFIDWAMPDFEKKAAGALSFTSGTPSLGFVDFGAGTPAVLHGREAVVPESRADEFVARQEGAPVDNRVADELIRMRSDFNEWVRQQPTMLALALRDYPQIGAR